MMTQTQEHIAERTCVGCRETDSRDALLRFVLMGEPPQLVPDIRRRAMGRGVSVHPRFACVERAVRTGAFRRAFRCELQADATTLADFARLQYVRRVEGLLQSARRAGKLAVGTDAVRSAMERREASLLLVAADAAGRRQELVEHAERLGGRCVVFGMKDSLGELLGRTSVGVVAIGDAGIAEEIRRAAQSAAELAEDA